VTRRALFVARRPLAILTSNTVERRRAQPPRNYYSRRHQNSHRYDTKRRSHNKRYDYYLRINDLWHKKAFFLTPFRTPETDPRHPPRGQGGIVYIPLARFL